MPYSFWANYGGIQGRCVLWRCCLPSLVFLLLFLLLVQPPAAGGSVPPRHQPRQQQQEKLLQSRRPPVRFQHHHVSSIVRRGFDDQGDAGASRPVKVLRRLKHGVSEGWRRWKQERNRAAMAEEAWKPDVTKQQQQGLPNLDAWRPDDGPGQHKSHDWLLFDRQSRAAAAFVAQEMTSFPRLLDEKHEAYGCMRMCCTDLLQINIWNRLQHGDEYKVLHLPQAWHICASDGTCTVDKMAVDNAGLVFQRLEEEEKESSSLSPHRQRQGQHQQQPTPDSDVPPAAAAFHAANGLTSNTAITTAAAAAATATMEGKEKDVNVDDATMLWLRSRRHREKLVDGGGAYNRYNSDKETGTRRRSSPLFAWPSSSLAYPLFLSIPPAPPSSSLPSTSASSSPSSSSSQVRDGVLLQGLRERYRSIRSGSGMRALWKAVSASSSLSTLSSSASASSSSSSAPGAPARGFQRHSYRFMLVDGKK